MKIDLTNYEAYFLDFVEGRLDDSSTLEMLAFLRTHPELKAELEVFGEVKLQPAEIEFEDKALLKKLEFGSAVNTRNFDDYCIAYHEKILTPIEAETLLTYLDKNPEKKSDFQKYGKTFLKADSSITFAAKPFLKKKPKGVAFRTIVLRWTAVAASVALAIAIYYRAPETKNIIKVEKPVVIQNKQGDPTSSTLPENFTNKSKAVNTIKIKKAAKQSSLQPSGNYKEVTEIAYENDFEYLNPIPVNSLENLEEIARPELESSPVAKTEVALKYSREDMELFDYAQKVLEKKVLKKQSANAEKRFSLWDVADVALKGYNVIAEKDIKLHQHRDEQGKLTAVAIETENRTYGFESKN